jgi:hypothetical protein
VNTYTSTIQKFKLFPLHSYRLTINEMGIPQLIGVYQPPRVRSRERVWCEYREQWCRITTWSEGRIPWPRCAPIGAGGGSGLWIDETLKIAILTESGQALEYWFGISGGAVWRWRRAFEIRRLGTIGSKRLHQVKSREGADAVKAKEWTADDLERKRRTSLRLGLRPPNRWAESGWTADELALLGTMPDVELAAKLGRTSAAVRAARRRLHIPLNKGRA